MDFTTEIVNRAIKYLIEGLFVAIAAIFVPKKSLPVEEILTLACRCGRLRHPRRCQPIHRRYGSPGRWLRYRCQPSWIPDAGISAAA